MSVKLIAMHYRMCPGGDQNTYACAVNIIHTINTIQLIYFRNLQTERLRATLIISTKTAGH
jgi:hypothetical protein